MEIFHSVILAITQGLTEFIPVSSSGHLVLFPWIFSFPDHGLTFDIILHLGTAVALIIFLRKDLYLIIKGFISLLASKSNYKEYYAKLSLLIIIATIPAVIIGLLGENFFTSTFRNPLSVAFFLILIRLFMI